MLRPTALLVLPLGSTSIPPRSNSLCSTLCCSLIGYILIFSFLMVLIPDWFWSFGLAVLSARFHQSPFLALFMFLILTYMWQNWGSNDTAHSKTINWVISNWISFLLLLQTQRWLFEDLKHNCPTGRTFQGSLSWSRILGTSQFCDRKSKMRTMSQWNWRLCLQAQDSLSWTYKPYAGPSHRLRLMNTSPQFGNSDPPDTRHRNPDFCTLFVGYPRRSCKSDWYWSDKGRLQKTQPWKSPLRGPQLTRFF